MEITKHFNVQDMANTMGPQSQHRRSPIKNCKIQSTGRLSKKKQQQTTKTTKTTMNELSVDAVPPTCKKCERGVTYKKPHHPTCPESNFYKKNSHRFTSRTPTSVWVAANNNKKKSWRRSQEPTVMHFSNQRGLLQMVLRLLVQVLRRSLFLQLVIVILLDVIVTRKYHQNHRKLPSSTNQIFCLLKS